MADFMQSEFNLSSQSMTITVNHNHFFHFHDKEMMEKINLIINKLQLMGFNTDKALADLAAINEQLTKVGAETATLLQKITDLETTAANADTPQSVLDAIAVVKTQAQVVDDEVPDAPTV